MYFVTWYNEFTNSLGGINMDRVDNLIELVKDEIDTGMENRMWAEMADVIVKYDIKEHLQDLEKASTPSDVAEACIDYLDDLRDRLKREVIRDDLVAKWLDVEVE